MTEKRKLVNTAIIIGVICVLTVFLAVGAFYLALSMVYPTSPYNPDYILGKTVEEITAHYPGGRVRTEIIHKYGAPIDETIEETVIYYSLDIHRFEGLLPISSRNYTLRIHINEDGIADYMREQSDYGI